MAKTVLPKVRHKKKKSTPIQPMQKLLDEAATKELPSKAETGHIKHEKKERELRR